MLCSYGCGKEAIKQMGSGNWCCSTSHNKCPEMKRKNSENQKNNHVFPNPKDNPANKKHKCGYCNRSISWSNLKKHLDTCYLNPQNKRDCPVCNSSIKDYKNNKTCSSKCARKRFLDEYTLYGNMGGVTTLSDDECSYRTICFRYHEKKCIICGEENIVAVHHFDEDRENDNPENLIPMCMTHHSYMHSKFKNLILERVEEYRNSFNNF